MMPALVGPASLFIYVRDLFGGHHGESPTVFTVGGNRVLGKRTVAPAVVAGYALLLHVNTYFYERTG